MMRFLSITAIVFTTVAAHADEPATRTVTVTHSAVEGIGAETGVMRRDPSDIIKVDELYYVWYSKGKISPGYDATVWYATSTDGHKWTEEGMALAKGTAGMKGENYGNGFQSVPVNWKISSPRKKAFSNKLREITGGSN